MPLSTIAIAYRTSTASTTICALEAAKFDVFCPGYHIAGITPHYALAIGGIAIQVPSNQAQDALILLHDFAQADIRRATLVRSVLNGLGFLAFGVSSPWPDLLLRDMPGAVA